MFSCAEDTRSKKNEKLIHLGSKQPYSYNNQEYLYSYKHQSSDFSQKNSNMHTFHRKKRIFEEEPKRASPYKVSAYYKENPANYQYNYQYNYQQNPANYQYNYQQNPATYQQYNYNTYANSSGNYQSSQQNNTNLNMRESIKGQSEISFVPFERTYYEQVPLQKIEYVPQEHRYTDYYAIERQRDYVPVSHLETVERLVPEERVEYVPQKRLEYVPQPRTEMVPVERLREKVELHPMERSIVHYPRFQGEFVGDVEPEYWENQRDWREAPQWRGAGGGVGQWVGEGVGVGHWAGGGVGQWVGGGVGEEGMAEWQGYRDRERGLAEGERNYYYEDDYRGNELGFYGNRYDLDLRYKPFERNRKLNGVEDRDFGHRHMNYEYV